MNRSRQAPALYIGGASLSMFGNSAIMIVLPWLVLSTTGSLASAGLIAAVSAVSSVPAALTGGRLIDRFGARNVAVLADIGSAASVAGLVLVDATVGLSVPWFMALGAARAVFDIPGMTARQSMLAGVSLVSGTTVDKIAGLFQGGFSLALLLGPGIAGLLLSVLDPIDVVWVTAACSAAAALATALVPVMGQSFAQDSVDVGSALAVFRRTPALRAMVVIAFTTSLATPPIISLLLPGHFQPDRRAGTARFHHVGVRGRHPGRLAGVLPAGAFVAAGRIRHGNPRPHDRAMAGRSARRLLDHRGRHVHDGRRSRPVRSDLECVCGRKGAQRRAWSGDSA